MGSVKEVAEAAAAATSSSMSELTATVNERLCSQASLEAALSSLERSMAGILQSQQLQLEALLETKLAAQSASFEAKLEATMAAHTAAMEARFAELPARAVEAMETQASFSCGPASIPPPSRTLEQTTSLPL